mgnify:FL=1
MFRPLLLLGISEHKLKMDNDSINKAVIDRQSMRMNDDKNTSLNEDSFFPSESVPECGRLLKEVMNVINKEVHPDLRSFNVWSHILEDKEQTMFHHHSQSGFMPGISWVYYSKVPKNSGNIVWTFEANAQRVTEEADPEEGKLILFAQNIPHFTKKNNSGESRISISGNVTFPADMDQSKFDPGNLLNYVGLFRG